LFRSHQLFIHVHQVAVLVFYCVHVCAQVIIRSSSMWYMISHLIADTQQKYTSLISHQASTFCFIRLKLDTNSTLTRLFLTFWFYCWQHFACINICVCVNVNVCVHIDLSRKFPHTRDQVSFIIDMCSSFRSLIFFFTWSVITWKY
jgi:hypothetical protein